MKKFAASLITFCLVIGLCAPAYTDSAGCAKKAKSASADTKKKDAGSKTKGGARTRVKVGGSIKTRLNYYR